MRLKKVFVVFIAIFWTCVQANPVQSEQKCGRRDVGAGTSIGGNPSSVNAWPWLVVFGHRIAGNRNFFCGGSLVSAKHVVSAAQCFQNKWQKNITSPRDFLAFVGKHNLNVEDEIGSAVHKVWEVIVHQDWKINDTRWDADIALIVLLNEVDLSDFRVVGIVCLPPSSEHEVTGTGTISGWGWSEESQKQRTTFNSTPNELQLPAVTQSVCEAADNRFAIVSSDRTFCAGYVNQNKTTCQGDSGSGFYQLKKRKYNLAGVVSTSLVNNNVDCVMDSYSIFTDVSKFTDWVKNKIDETKQINWQEVDFKCETFGYNVLDCNHEFTGPMKRNLKIKTGHKRATRVRGAYIDFGSSEFIFSGIAKSFANLKELSVVSGKIKFIEKEDFIGLEKLERLRLDYNQIEFLPDDVFSGLSKLKRINLSNNQIKELPERVFWSSTSLTRLDLGYNQIEELPENLLNNLTKLRYLYFNDNLIEFFPSKLFSNKPELKEIYINDNKNTTIDFDFSSYPILQFYNVSGLFSSYKFF